MNQPNMSVVIGSAIALLMPTQPVQGAMLQPNQLEEATQISLRIPTQPRRERPSGTRGDGVYAIAPRQMEGMDVIWRDRPRLIWDVTKEVEVTLVEIYDTATDTQLWSQSVSPEARWVAYAGEPLQPGGRYEWRLCDSNGNPLPGGIVQFQVLAAAAHQRIAAELDSQNTMLSAQGASDVTLAEQQANFFAQRHLWADALMTIFSPEKLPESLAQAKQFIEDLAHINRWLEIANFTGNSPRSDADNVQIQILPDQRSEAAEDNLQGAYKLSYTYNPDHNEWDEPNFRVKLTNPGTETVFVALFDLTDSFSIEPLFEADTVRLNPGQTVWLNDGDPIYGIVPDELWQQGTAISQDIYKAIACTTDFEPSFFLQGELYDPQARQSSALLAKTPLKHLLQRAIEAKAEHQGKSKSDIQWFTSQVSLTFVRPSEEAH